MTVRAGGRREALQPQAAAVMSSPMSGGWPVLYLKEAAHLM